MQTLCLLGGMGLGAGLMYLLDPHQGDRRRDRVRGYVEDYGRQTGAFVDDAGRGLGRQAQAVFATARRPFHRQPGLGERLLTQVEQLGTTTGMVLVGGVGLGVGLGYLWACQGRPQQRARWREKARTYWRPTQAAMPTSGRSPGAGTFSKIPRISVVKSQAIDIVEVI